MPLVAPTRCFKAGSGRALDVSFTCGHPMKSPNTLESRICALFQSLNAAFVGGCEMSSASKGTEREIFVTNVLQQVFPPHFRFSSGDIVDSHAAQSGQVDIVLEHPRGYSFPLAYAGPRLFLAENVAAVIEVKSNLINQWCEVVSTADKLACIRPKYSSESWAECLEALENGKVEIGEGIQVEEVIKGLRSKIENPANIGRTRIPLIVVGYSGWKTDGTLVEKLIPDRIDGILLLDSQKYATKFGRAEGKEVATGVGSLMGLLHRLDVEFHSQAERWPVGYF